VSHRRMSDTRAWTTLTRETESGPLTAFARPGTGTPIVFVHGVMADAYAWRAVAGKVSPERPALIVNRRGRTPSGPIPGGYSVGSEVDDLMGWLDLQDEPVVVVGHSYGGLIAVEAVRRGAPVRSLVLYEPVTRPFAPEAVPLVTGAISDGDLGRAVEVINIDVSGYSTEHVDQLRSSPAWDKLELLAAPAGDELVAIADFDLDVPSPWRTPTTLIAGALSRHRAPYGPSVDAFRNALGIDEVFVLAGQDHLAHVTAPADLAGAIEQGLEGRG